MEHRVVSHKEWLEARKRHLAVEKEYGFEGPSGRATLSELFQGRGQLVVYHAMFNPDTASESTTWITGAPCMVCSYWMDNFDGVVVHLNHRDVTMAAVSYAPYENLAAYRKRM